MLRSSSLSGRSFFWVCALPAQHTCFLYASPISLSNISPTPCSPMACCYAMRSRLPSSPLRTASHAVRLSHPASRSTRVAPPSRTALHPPPCQLQLAIRRDAAGVLLTPPFPTRRSWSLSTPWTPWHATSARRCCDESECCKRMFQMFQTFSEVCCNCFI
jgi:hypothetical protein